ncbi:Hypothetical Protein FCC1311_094142 [Hondaea fermentalgiana]|uniref:Uncharacterized protein n=1 Tax=Hondaea fermentalgiana TaxID=2315210 RepID=A0A2R5GQR3_9STRA|nr:Hypothetical Protein FCC1311_094142 [Hondaea fermentalgiana]|eukprot:GBG33190.1 Hypothetical Protein FCC1311_094142 [Hondaea fermentalgiana]
MLVLVRADQTIEKLAEMVSLFSSALAGVVSVKKAKAKLASVAKPNRRRRRPRTVTCSSEELRRQVAGQDPVKLYAPASVASITEALQECKQAAQLRVDAGPEPVVASSSSRVPPRPIAGQENAFLQKMWDNLYANTQSPNKSNQEEEKDEEPLSRTSSGLSTSSASSSSSAFSAGSAAIEGKKSCGAGGRTTKNSSVLARDVREKLKSGKTPRDLIETIQSLTLGA